MEHVILIVIAERRLYTFEWLISEEDWDEVGKMKTIMFELDNDQQYFAKIPADKKLVDIYEVHVHEIK